MEDGCHDPSHDPQGSTGKGGAEPRALRMQVYRDAENAKYDGDSLMLVDFERDHSFICCTIFAPMTALSPRPTKDEVMLEVYQDGRSVSPLPPLLLQFNTFCDLARHAYQGPTKSVVQAPPATPLAVSTSISRQILGRLPSVELVG